MIKKEEDLVLRRRIMKMLEGLVSSFHSKIIPL